MAQALNLQGRRFGRLVSLSPTHAGEVRAWRCQCDCGRTARVVTHKLIMGHTRSCGCLQAQVTTERNLRHGRSKTPEHDTWLAMRQRCSNPKHRSFKHYGARGITVCQRWSSFEAFFADMGLRPSSRYTIERIDNEGPYSPSNCRWATRMEQGANSRRNRRLTYRGETLTLSEWARRFKIQRLTLLMRLKSGLTVAEALERPVQKRSC